MSKIIKKTKLKQKKDKNVKTKHKVRKHSRFSKKVMKGGSRSERTSSGSSRKPSVSRWKKSSTRPGYVRGNVEPGSDIPPPLLPRKTSLKKEQEHTSDQTGPHVERSSKPSLKILPTSSLRGRPPEPPPRKHRQTLLKLNQFIDEEGNKFVFPVSKLNYEVPVTHNPNYVSTIPLNSTYQAKTTIQSYPANNIHYIVGKNGQTYMVPGVYHFTDGQTTYRIPTNNTI